MKIQTKDLIGAALDWAVARAEGKRPSMFIVQQTGALAKEHCYSTNWAQGGPIKERNGIISGPSIKGDFFAVKAGTPGAFGPSELVAAMRCHVATKLGDVVEVPDELV